MKKKIKSFFDLKKFNMWVQEKTYENYNTPTKNKIKITFLFCFYFASLVGRNSSYVFL